MVVGIVPRRCLGPRAREGERVKERWTGGARGWPGGGREGAFRRQYASQRHPERLIVLRCVGVPGPLWCVVRVGLLACICWLAHGLAIICRRHCFAIRVRCGDRPVLIHRSRHG